MIATVMAEESAKVRSGNRIASAQTIATLVINVIDVIIKYLFLSSPAN